MAHTFNTNLANVALQYVKQLNIPITGNTISQSITQNPFYPSLYSLSNTFNKYNIENVAFEATEQQLEELQAPFIAYLQTPATGKDFVLVTKNAIDNVSYIAQGNKEITVTKKDFLNRWQKIVLLAEANEKSGEKDYLVKLKAQKKKQTQKRAIYIGFALVLALLIVNNYLTTTNSTILNTVILLTKLLGVAIATLLLIYEIDKSNAFVKNICTAGKQTNCDAVLNSKAAKFLGMSWSEIGFFYFATTLLFFLLPITNTASTLFLLSINAITVAAYIPFSIYYQYKVVKQWCPLCLATQVILLLELGWSIFHINTNTTNFNEFFAYFGSSSPLLWRGVGGEVLIATAIICTWYLIKPLLLAAKDTPNYQYAYKRLLYHPDTFNTTLQQQNAVDGWQNLGITIGNLQAPNTILKVCNPYCGPCAKAHPVLEELIHNNDDYKLQIIFTTKPNATDDGKNPTSHLMAVLATGDKQKIQQALDDWYLAPKKDYSEFAKKYPMNGELKHQYETLEKMSKWCDLAEIQFTPTIFINGRQLPNNYSIDELKYIL